MKLCQCCNGFLATRFVHAVPVCYSCFQKMDTRLLADLPDLTPPQRQLEIEKLESWWNSTLEGANR